MPEFKAELERQRDEVAAEAFGVLSRALKTGCFSSPEEEFGHSTSVK